MNLYYLVSNTWVITLNSNEEPRKNILQKQIFKFDFKGLMSGYSNICFPYQIIKDTVYIETFYHFGLLSFKLNHLKTCLTGERILDDGSVSPLTGEIASPFDDSHYYRGIEQFLDRKIWRIIKMGSMNLLYLIFINESVRLFDAFGLKLAASGGFEDEGNASFIKHMEFKYKIEKQKITLYTPYNNQQSGILEINDNMSLQGFFQFGSNQRHSVVNLYEMTDVLIEEVLGSITEDDRYFQK